MSTDNRRSTSERIPAGRPAPRPSERTSSGRTSATRPSERPMNQRSSAGSRNMSTRGSRKRRKSKGSALGRVLAVIGLILAFVLVLLVVACLILFRGPSETAKREWVNMFNETSQMKWLPRMFLSNEEVDDIINSSNIIEVDVGTVSNTEDIDVSQTTDEVEVFEVSGGSFKGVMMIVHDPSKVFLGTVPEFYEGAGMVVNDIINTCYPDVIGGVNAGDFVDLGPGNSFTAMPLGLVISEGQIVMCESGDYDTPYHISGFTNDNKFVLGYISANEAIEMGIRDAVYTNEITTGPYLIMNGQPMIEEVPDSTVYGGGPNPRTVIGQRQDGAVVMLVVDGRQANSIGATFVDLIYLLQDYDVYNACAMDGGTSSQMIYNGEILNHPYSGSPRKCPTAWLVRQ
ncbi:MAG: phosphodiester glycosidase family protein [Parasporobacterium sp.]|nr:phosphodiester glycosidase family protein [Parasporobacterium sp.]